MRWDTHVDLWNAGLCVCSDPPCQIRERSSNMSIQFTALQLSNQISEHYLEITMILFSSHHGAIVSHQSKIWHVVELLTVSVQMEDTCLHDRHLRALAGYRFSYCTTKLGTCKFSANHIWIPLEGDANLKVRYGTVYACGRVLCCAAWYWLVAGIYACACPRAKISLLKLQ